MRKLRSKDFTTDPNIEFLPVADTFEHLQEAYGEVFDALLTAQVGGAPSGGYIIFGCVNTVVGASNSISAGAIYFWLNAGAWSNVTTYNQYDLISKNGNEYISLNGANLNHDPETSPLYWIRVGGHLTGQVFLVDAVVLNPLANAVVAKIVPTFFTPDPSLYTDGSTANVHAIFKIVFVDAVSGTGVSDFADLETIPQKWKAAASFGANWSNSANAAYRKDGNGKATLRGLVSGTNAVGSGIIFTLPVGFRPKVIGEHPVALSSATLGSISPLYRIVVNVNGNITLADVADYVANHPTVPISLNGIEFYVD